MIKEIVNEINNVESQAGDIVKKSRETAGEIIRKARYQTGETIEDFHKKRSGFITQKVAKAEQKGKDETEKIKSKTRDQSLEIERDARGNFDEAVALVYERVINYGS